MVGSLHSVLSRPDMDNATAAVTMSIVFAVRYGMVIPETECDRERTATNGIWASGSALRGILHVHVGLRP